MDPVSGPLESWVDGELVLKSYHEATKWMLKMEVVKGMFTEEMGYSGMTMSALGDQMKATLKLFVVAQNVAAHREFDRGKRDEQAVTVAELSRTIAEKAKVKEELELAQGRLEAEMKKNVVLLLSVNKLAAEKRGLGEELSKSQKDLDEANRRIEAFTSELRSCYDNAMKDYMDSAEYQDKLASQRVEGYFDLIEKVGEKYTSLDWGFLWEDAKEVSTVPDEGAMAVSGTPTVELVVQASESLVQGSDTPQLEQ
ncbi:PREDICTED: E3 ubiquitin-ligase [Prunus dulcis]|uniref:PREDICTED: E3 ubiquitin-ligase n=1 Tax=Prunus dulcis TaxID=3755 RepID=A0A5E4GNP0_PRUDU|nr:PREDICTED: E3 ubiquitin-ligase [Prunus dulcis]